MNLFVTLLLILKLLDPIPTLPTKIENFVNTIGTIIQHEAGNVPSSYNFVYNQILHDLKTIKCENLTKSRWAIKSFPKPREAILKVVKENRLEYPKCQFIGNPNDIKIWNSYGYRTKVDYTFKSGNLTVIGVNCGKNLLFEHNSSKIRKLEEDFK